MRLLRLAAALTFSIALVALSTASAFGAAVTEDVKWYEGSGTGTELSGSSFFFLDMPEKSTFTFTTEVGSTKYVLHATGVDLCEGCTISNTGGVATGSVQFEFTGVTVVEPKGCTTPSKLPIKRLSLTADWMIGSANYWKFVPAAGETAEWAKIQITGCALETTMVPRGSLFVQSQNATGTQAEEQEVHSSAAINTAAGGSLKVGTKTATLTGNLIASLGDIVFPTPYFGTH